MLFRSGIHVKSALNLMKKYADNASHPAASALNHEAYKCGCELFAGGKYQRAKLAFKEALAYWPQDPQAWMALGNCEDALNKPKRAETCLRQALLYCSEQDLNAIRFNLANSLLDQQRHAAAIELYQLIPGDSEVYGAAQRNLSIARGSTRP